MPANQPDDPFPLPRRGLMRRVAGGAMVAFDAVVIGDVILEEDVTVWFNVTIRGDDAPITIGARTNVQDNTCIHCDTDVPQVIGTDCTIGHSATVHGASIGNRVLIGMGATILGGAKVGDGAVIAAGAVVRENFEVPPNTLVAGVPAKIIREINAKDQAFMAHSVPHYIKTALSYLAAD
ncbi:MAG: gamma carbonic anhydrase family protein [Planctomycetes bacterium]|nr:gamma carbonic anhydrase family protein [Planctomycetota bacterium]